MSTDLSSAVEKPKSKMSTLSAGLALFSMFFGAGNLVFPLILGRDAGVHTPAALVGLGISAVCFPFLGLLAMTFYGGDLKTFLQRLGKWPAFWCLLILQVILGPAGCIPRLFILMHASLKPFISFLSMPIFSAVLCVLIFFLTYRPQRIITLLGTVLTPFLLATLSLLIYSGLQNASAAHLVQGSALHFVKEGLKGGYQMMDLISALLFSTLIIPHLSKQNSSRGDSKEVFRKMTWASVIAAVLLMITYLGLGWIAAHHSDALANTSPEDLLHVLALALMGPIGVILSASAVFLACLTTAISLVSVFAEYLRKNLSQDQISPSLALVVTLVISMAIANLGFTGIMKMGAPLLAILYPALIVLCLLNIGYLTYQIKPVKAPVFFVLGFAAGGFFFG